MSKIFINYRRGDDPGFTQALYQSLEAEFGYDALFMDIEGRIKPGDDFVEILSTEVAACDTFLAVIGPRWQDLLAARGSDPNDFVIIEIETALQNDTRVIPVLVGGARMPRAEVLKETVRPLARRNAVSLRPERFAADCRDLVDVLQQRAGTKKSMWRSLARRTIFSRNKRPAHGDTRRRDPEPRHNSRDPISVSKFLHRFARSVGSWYAESNRGEDEGIEDDSKIAHYLTAISRALIDYADALAQDDRGRSITHRYYLDESLHNMAYILDCGESVSPENRGDLPRQQ